MKKRIPNLDEFVNESKGIVNTEVKVVKNGQVRYDIDDMFAREAGITTQEIAEQIADDLNLLNGSINLQRKSFSVSGVTTSGKKLEISQDGEYNMYGGPYNPKFEDPTVKLNGKDLFGLIKKEFKKDGWFEGSGKDSDIDVSRVDIWGHLTK